MTGISLGHIDFPGRVPIGTDGIKAGEALQDPQPIERVTAVTMTRIAVHWNILFHHCGELRTSGELRL
ncbi:hypothetical protein [Deinococcus sp.]|uniref:hypothetical protein n=1 Tax=Deinococcus sp. TaxID=47478 RepID=UPI00391939DA